MLGISEPLAWTILAVLFAVVEGFTLGLTSVWFSVGALVALLAAAIGLPFWVQIAVFLISSGVMVIYTRPMAIKIFKIGTHKTNVDSLIEKVGIVTKEISEFEVGHVKVKGQIWSAKSIHGETIEEGKKVVVHRIEGVKLFVDEYSEIVDKESHGNVED